jgi:hypothetical protein
MKRFSMLSLCLLVVCAFSGCGPSVREASTDATAAVQAQLEQAKAQAEFQTTQATAWKASDAKHEQQLADQGKTVAQLNGAVAKMDGENADLAARLTQAKADLNAAVIARDRYDAALIAVLCVIAAVLAYAVSDYFVRFQFILRPIAYGAAGLAVAAWIFREVRPYAAPIEGALVLLLLGAAIYELDVHTVVGKWIGWVIGKVESVPVLKKIIVGAEADAAKAKTDLAAASADVKSWK